MKHVVVILFCLVACAKSEHRAAREHYNLSLIHI